MGIIYKIKSAANINPLRFLFLIFSCLLSVVKDDRFLHPLGQVSELLTAVVPEHLSDNRHFLPEGMEPPVVDLVAVHPICQNLSRLLAGIVAVGIAGHKPVVVLVYVQHVRVLTVFGQVFLLDRLGVDSALLDFFQHRHIGRRQVEVSVNNARLVLPSASSARCALEGEDLLVVDALQDGTDVVQSLEKLLQNQGIQKSKAHYMRLGHDHQIAVEESTSTRHNVEVLGVVHDVLLIRRRVVVDPAEQALVCALCHHAGGVLGRVVANINVFRIQQGTEVVNDRGCADGVGLVNGTVAGQADDHRVKSVPAHAESGGKVYRVLVEVEHAFQHFRRKRPDDCAGMEARNCFDDGFVIDEGRLPQNND